MTFPKFNSERISHCFSHWSNSKKRLESPVFQNAPNRFLNGQSARNHSVISKIMKLSNPVIEANKLSEAGESQKSWITRSPHFLSMILQKGAPIRFYFYFGHVGPSVVTHAARPEFGQLNYCRCFWSGGKKIYAE